MLENSFFEIPKCLINEYKYDYEKNKIKISEENIKKIIKLELIINEIKNKFNIKNSKAEIEKVFNEINNKEKKINEIIYKNIDKKLLEEKILNLILSKCNKYHSNISYQNLKKLELENGIKY